jgi:hypothetical protein
VSSCVFRAAFVLASAVFALGVEPEAHAGGDIETPTGPSRPADPSVPTTWGLRLNGAVGLVAIADDKDLGVVWRAGLDYEYWLWRNLGIGVQFGFQELGTVNWCPGGCDTMSAYRASAAPTISIRGNSMAVPTVSLGLGLSWGHSEETYNCDPCYNPVSGRTFDGWGPYGSLTVAWVFHPGGVRPGSETFAIGPLMRMDAFMLFNGQVGETFTTGISLGWGGAREAAR